MKYEMSWTQKDGKRIEGQVYTAEYITQHLLNLEKWGATDIIIKSVQNQNKD